jgi:hypothetical protein
VTRTKDILESAVWWRGKNKWLARLFAAVENRLARHGITLVSESPYSPSRYYGDGSYDNPFGNDAQIRVSDHAAGFGKLEKPTFEIVLDGSESLYRVRKLADEAARWHAAEVVPSEEEFEEEFGDGDEGGEKATKKGAKR